MTSPTPDFLQLVHPRSGPSRQAKFYLSQEMFDRLKTTAFNTGLDMSQIVDQLVREFLPDTKPKTKPEPKRRSSFLAQH